MAKLVPNVPDASTESPAEVELFQLLKQKLPDDYTVFHSVAYLLGPQRSARPAREGEIDFLIAHPEKGLLAIEVKGGDIECDGEGRRWFSTGNKGRWEIKDPFRQAQSGIHDIVRIVEDRNVLGGPADFTFGHAVAFPQCEFRARDLPPHAQRAIIIDSRDVGDLQDRIEEIFRFWSQGRNNKPLGSKRLRKIVNQVLAPRFRLVQSVAGAMAREEHALLRLTSEQELCLDFLDRNPVSIIEGSAGTGKTVLAVDHTRRLAEQGLDVLLLCYNKLLGAHLRKTVESFEGLSGTIWVGHFHALCEERARKAGIEIPAPPDQQGTDAGRYWNETLPFHLLEACENLPERDRFDAIVVDEAQDFRPGWWVILKSLFKESPERRLTIFHDPLQNIFGCDPLPREGRPLLPLHINCRNTLEIAQYAAGLVDAEWTPSSWSVSGEKPRTSKVRGPEETRKEIKRIVAGLLEGDVRPGQITLLSTHRFEKSALAGVQRIAGVPLEQIPDEGVNPKGKHLGFSTLHRFKGLDSDVVIVMDTDPTDRVTARHRYVAASRARHRLFVVQDA